MDNRDHQEIIEALEEELYKMELDDLKLFDKQVGKLIINIERNPKYKIKREY